MGHGTFIVQIDYSSVAVEMFFMLNKDIYRIWPNYQT